MNITQSDKYIGIDGCRSGWCAAIIENDVIEIKIYSSIAQILKEHQPSTPLLIDIPIGLSGPTFQRKIDSELRALLKPHKHSSVFTPPSRKAVYSDNYEDAKNINEEITGKKISKQSYNISDKIREVDELISGDNSIIPLLIESHPELCFKILNNGQTLTTSKKNQDGQSERINILAKYHKNCQTIIDKALSRYLRKDVQIDDIIDALCLAITIWISKKEIEFITQGMDEHNIPIRIAYPKS